MSNILFPFSILRLVLLRRPVCLTHGLLLIMRVHTITLFQKCAKVCQIFFFVFKNFTALSMFYALKSLFTPNNFP